MSLFSKFGVLGQIKYLLDLLTTPASAYSLRRLKSTSTLAIRVRRSNDNAETDIGFVGFDLDTTTLLSFVGSNSGFVTTWYDQGINGKHAIQTTIANQPRIVNDGVIETDVSGKPTIRFTGGTVGFAIAGGVLTGATHFSTNAVFNYEGVDAYEMALSQSNGLASAGNLEIRRNISSDSTEVVYGNSQPPSYGLLGTINNVRQILVSTRIAGTSMQSWRSGTSVHFAADTNATPIINTTAYVGRRFDGYGFNGTISEITCLPSALSTADRQLLERNQGAYYGISVA